MAQPFIYIFAIILGGLILIWGFKMIYGFISVANKAEIGQMKDMIDKEVKTYMNYGEGASKPIKLSLPKNIQYICISKIGDTTVNCKKKLKTTTGAPVACGDISKIDSSLSNVVKAGKMNLLFTPFAKAGLSNGKFKIENLQPEEGANPLCFANGATLTLTTKAGYVEAS